MFEFGESSLRRRQSKPPDSTGDFVTRPDATQARRIQWEIRLKDNE